MIITTEITKTVIDTDKVEALVRELLDERFGDEFVFDPIEVHARIFDDGIDVEDYLEIYVVFDGDPKRLPASWTAGLAVLMEPGMMKMGCELDISKAFFTMAEWKEILEERANNDRQWGSH